MAERYSAPLPCVGEDESRSFQFSSASSSATSGLQRDAGRVAGRGTLAHLVVRQQEIQILGRREQQREAPGNHVLIVHLRAVDQILVIAVALARKHGDFARHFPQTPDIGRRPVGEFMTRRPITISGERLAAEVLHVLQMHRIDDIVVVDAEDRPIGVVDSQDLSRLKIL